MRLPLSVVRKINSIELDELDELGVRPEGFVTMDGTITTERLDFSLHSLLKRPRLIS
jgi:hypothetical protein